MTYQSEHELEELLIAQLSEQGYIKVNIPDEAKLLEKNFRETLFEFNRKKLGMWLYRQRV